MRFSAVNMALKPKIQVKDMNYSVQVLIATDVTWKAKAFVWRQSSFSRVGNSDNSAKYLQLIIEKIIEKNVKIWNDLIFVYINSFDFNVFLKVSSWNL